MSRKATRRNSQNLVAQFVVLSLFLSFQISEVKGALNATVTSLTQSSVNFTLESTILSASDPAFDGAFWYVGDISCNSDDPACPGRAPTAVSNDSTYPPEVYFDGLLPGLVYSLTIDGIWTNASTNDPSDLTFTICTAPVAPDMSGTGYEAGTNQITIQGLSINIQPLDNNGSLTHYGIDNSSSDGSRSAGPVGKAQNLVIFNLTSATAYTFEVYAYNDGCGGMEPSPTFSSYNACTAADGALTVNKVSSDSLTVVVPTNPDTFAIVSVKDASGTAAGNYSSSNLTADETVSSLDFGTKYTFNASATISGAKCRDRSITGFLIGTQCTYTIAPNVTGVSASSTATDTITITGLAARSVSDSNATGTTDGWSTPNTTEASSATGTFSDDAVFTGLTAGTEYTFSFKGYIDACSDATSIDEVTVVACTKPNTPALADGRSYQSNQTNITIYYDDFNLTGSLDYIRVSKSNSSDAGTLLPSDGIMSSSGDSVMISGLEAETTYTYTIEALFNGSSCLNLAVSDSLTATINTTVGNPNVTITSTTETTIVFTCSPSAACIGLEFGGSDGNPALSPFTNDSSTILGLSPGTSYNVSVDNGFDVDAACTKPVAPDFTSVSYYATLDTISILGNVSAVAATGSSGGITSYKFTEGTPNVTVAPQSSAVDSNMTIGTSGSSLLGNETMYNLTFVSVFTDSIGCPSGEEGTATTVLLLCTAPAQPTITLSGGNYVDSTTDSITIDFAEVSATEAFQVVSAVDNSPLNNSVSSGDITTGYQGSGSSVTLSSLSPGTVYTITMQSSYSNSGQCLNTAESSTADTVALCTVPSAPTLNVTSVDHETISVSVNGSSSTTVNGLVLNETSHSISPSGTFTSTGNVNGLTPGTEFTVSLALAIDTSIANCPESAASLLTGATGSASGCTYPLAPDMSSFSTSSDNFDQTSSSIRILGSVTNLTVTSGGFDQYSLNDTAPSGGIAGGGLFDFNADMNITGLDSGTVYTVYLDGYVGSNCNLASQTPANISNLCTAPSAPNVTVASATDSSATILASSANVTKEAGAPAGESFDKYQVIEVNGVAVSSPTAYAVNVDSPVPFSSVQSGTAYNMTVQSIKKESCINGGSGGIEGDTATFTFCTSPAAPTVTVHSTTGYYETKVTIENITSSQGSVDYFDAYITPEPTAAGFSNQTSVDIATASNYDYDNLDAGSEYTLTVTVTKNSTDCGITQSSDLTSAATTATVCTAPLPPDLSSVDIQASNGSNNASIVVNASPSSPITTTPSGGVLDGYEIMDVTLSSDSSSVSFTGSPSANVTNSSSLTINLPYLGTSYDLSFASFTTRHCSNAYIRSEGRTNITRCTAPWQPNITSSDTSTVATINQTSITLVGASINSSDTYAVTNLTSGTTNISSVADFSEQRATSAADDIVLSNLTAGTVYNIDIVGIIGNSTSCGGFETYGEPTTIRVCTDPPDVTPAFSSVDSTSIALDSILPSTGWDFYTITATPALPSALDSSVTNQSNGVSSNTLTLTGLDPGTEYNFTTSVAIATNCDYGTNNAVSNNSASACTQPLGPDFTGLSHNATNDTLTINSGSGNITDPAGGGSITNYIFSRTDPTGGSSTSGWVSRTGGQVSITGLSSGRVYTAFFYGQLVGLNCGTVNGSTESNITDLCTEPSSPTISSTALSSTNDSITLFSSQVTAPSSETLDYIQVTAVTGPNITFSSPAASTDNVTVSGLTAGSSYTLSVVSSLGDTTTCATGRLVSPEANVTGCTEPPVPEIYWEGVNSTSIAISVNNTFGFDKWSATIVDDVGTTDSPDYSSASDKHYFTSNLSPNVQYTVTVTLTIGDGTDCGDMSAMTSTSEVNITEVGCNEPFPVDTTNISFTATTDTVILSGTGSPTNDMVISTNGTVIKGLYDVESTAIGVGVGNDAISTSGAVAANESLTITGFIIEGTVFTIKVFQNFSAPIVPTCEGTSTSTDMYVCTAPVAPKSDYVLNLSDNVGALKVSSFGVSAGGSADFYDFTFLPQDDENGVACTSTANVTKDNVAPGGEEEVFGLEPGCRYKLSYTASCLTPDSKSATSEPTFTSSVDGCAKPSEGLTNFTISAVSATQVNVSGLGAQNGTFADLDIIFRPDDSCTGEETKTITGVTTTYSVSPSTLAPGCPYTVLYTLNCYYDNFGSKSPSAQVTSPNFGCTSSHKAPCSCKDQN
ncbi:uncharacterized protein LOC142341300 [Convolutriloba macropyga]|uniref:uncharacterized protein LOC142341300 n=1 Tax=Convolutriloba macropyga TaxID=536237 RepID=UPI003F51E4DC